MGQEVTDPNILRQLNAGGGQTSDEVFVPAPGAAEREARDNRGETRDVTRLGITASGEARQADEAKRNAVKQLSDAFNGQKLVQDYQTALPAYASIVELASKVPNKANDFTIITMYNKLQDPGSAVLEGERRSAQDIGTLYEKYSTQLKGLFDPETGFVSDAARKQFVQSAETLIQERRRGYDFMRRRYSDTAKSDTYKLDPALVIGPDFSADYDPVILENWNKLFPPDPKKQGGNQALQVAEGDRYATDQDIAITAQLQEAWNGGATADQINELSTRLTGKPLSDADLATLKASEGKPVNFAPAMSGNREATGLKDTVVDTAADIGTSMLKGYTGNMAEEIGGTLFGDTVGAKLQAAGDAASERSPILGLGGEVLGGVVSPLNKIPGLGAIENPIVREALTGGVQGAVYGAGEARPGADLTQRLEQGAFGALTGGVTGAAAGRFLGGRGGQAADDVAPSMDMPNLGGEVLPASVAPDVPPASVSPDVPLTEAAPANLPQEELTQLAELARKAVSSGPGSASAKREIAKMAKTSPEAAAAAERLGIELPPDILSDSAQLKAMTGLTRSQAGSSAEAAWRNTVAETSQKADDALAELGATRDLAETSTGVFQRMTGAMEGLERQASALRDEVDGAISATDRLEASSLQQALGKRIDELGGLEEAKQAFSKEEKRLLAMLGEGETANMPTYGRLVDLKQQIGRAINKGDGPWADVNQAALKRYYAALSDDQLAYIGKVGGEELADKMRGSNSLFAKMYEARGDMQALYGDKLQGSLTPLLTRAIEQGSKGDATALNKMLSKVPEDMRGGLLASGLLAKATGTGYQGGFNFANYAKYYRGLRANAPVYAEFAKALGPKGEQVLSDLYAISRRVAEGSGNVLPTGKANQPLLALNAERLLSRMFKGGAARAAGAGTGAVAGAVVGGPLGAAAGAGVADAVVNRMAGGAINSDKLHSLLSSPQFKAMIETGSDTDINRLAGSKPFIEWSKGVIPNSFKDRQAWIRATINPVAANISPEPPTIKIGAQ